jgi:6-phosphogluconate dehydrogenase
MKLGMIGLGRMGGNMVQRLEQDGHDVVTYTRSGGGTASTIEELVSELEPPRVAWMMVPAGDATETTFTTLLGLLEQGDVIVDGGNSNFRDSKRRYAEARERGIGFADAGVSGGIWGLEVGYCLMAGGDDETVAIVEPAFRTLAPEDGYAHCGPAGAGHFVKMVHNGIEYGLMQAYAEGFEIMHASEYELDLHEIAGIWRYGSVVRSWLLELLHSSFEQHGSGLGDIAGYVQDSGEGRWTIEEAINEDVPAPVIAAALFARFSSRQDESFAAKVSAALREQFGGHAIKTSGNGGSAPAS